MLSRRIHRRRPIYATGHSGCWRRSARAERWRVGHMRCRCAALALAALPLSGCGTWFGEPDAPPLPGERISVLQHQRTLAADPQAGLEPIVLPPALTNPDWPQAGGNSAHAMHNVQAGQVARPAWRVSIGAGVASDRPALAPPVVAAGRVFTIDTRHVVSAFEARTGERM